MLCTLCGGSQTSLGVETMGDLLKHYRSCLDREDLAKHLVCRFCGAHFYAIAPSCEVAGRFCKYFIHRCQHSIGIKHVLQILKQ